VLGGMARRRSETCPAMSENFTARYSQEAFENMGLA